jgi:hypothetical protein
MTKGKAVHDAVKWIVVRLSATMSAECVSMYTDLGIRTVQKIVSEFKSNGTITTIKQPRPTLHRSLTDRELQVSISIYFYL